MIYLQIFFQSNDKYIIYFDPSNGIYKYKILKKESKILFIQYIILPNSEYIHYFFINYHKSIIIKVISFNNNKI